MVIVKHPFFYSKTFSYLLALICVILACAIAGTILYVKDSDKKYAEFQAKTMDEKTLTMIDTANVQDIFVKMNDDEYLSYSHITKDMVNDDNRITDCSVLRIDGTTADQTAYLVIADATDEDTDNTFEYGNTVKIKIVKD